MYILILLYFLVIFFINFCIYSKEILSYCNGAYKPLREKKTRWWYIRDLDSRKLDYSEEEIIEEEFIRDWIRSIYGYRTMVNG